MTGLALEYLGNTLFYAPADKDGFFINRAVASVLQKDKLGKIRTGYQLEAFNSRGVHSIDHTGEAEFAIEAKYDEMAQRADNSGYFRFAETLRATARAYHEEGLRNIEEHECE